MDSDDETTTSLKYVKIIATPPGQAPQTVRDAWVGLTLPVKGGQAETKLGSGVTSLPKSFWGLLFSIFVGRTKPVRGYTVDALTAVEILEKKSPQAALWWRRNTPSLLQSGRALIFQAEVCQEVDD